MILSIQWLPATDAFAASCVCQQWLAALSSEQDETDLWKQVCLNTNSIVLTKLLKTEQETMDFRRLALGLMDRNNVVKPELSLTAPTLTPENVFAVVELYRTSQGGGENKRARVLEASWASKLSYPEGLVMPDQTIVLSGANPYSLEQRDSGKVKKWSDESWASLRPNFVHDMYFQSHPHAYAAMDIVEDDRVHVGYQADVYRALRIRVTLFRRDNMKSICIIDRRRHNIDLGAGNDVEFTNDVLKVDFVGDTRYFDSTNEGKNAVLLMHSQYRGNRRFSVSVDFLMEALHRPQHGSDEEPTWLANTHRELTLYHCYVPDKADRKALESISHFDFKITHCNIKFHAGHDVFESQNDMMIALAGLCWR